jgi:hypothetical protein
MKHALARLLFAGLAAGWAAGCLSVPDTQQPQCTSNSDCDTALGEVCDQGACWGGPPTGMFAAIIAPPSDRTDLTTVERAMQTLPRDGQLGNLQLVTPATISGRVEAFCVAPVMTCGNSIAATITVTRPPLFAGGPGFKTVATSLGGVPHGSNSFSISVPPTNDGEPDYVITVVPDGNGDLPPPNGMLSAAEQAPPRRITTAARTNLDVGTLVLGSDASQVLSGSLTDGATHALTKYRVVALGRLDTSGPVTEVSTVDYTANGQFALTVADGAIGPITIEARPYDANVVAPTLYMPGLDNVSSVHTLAQPPYLGAKMAVTIAIEGLGGDGAVKPVSGAHVTLTGTYEPEVGTGVGTRAVLSVDTTTGDDGLAHLTVLDGIAFATTYKLRVVPTSGSELGVIYDQDFTLGKTDPIRLPARVALRGRVVDRKGVPTGKISVTARPSLRFTWSLDPLAQEFVGEVPAPTTVSTDAGDFVVWVDPYVATVWGHYDLAFAAPKGIDAASWTHTDIEIPRMLQTAVSVGDETIPDTAFMHGKITDALNVPVNGGELRIFRVSADDSLCGVVPYEPAGCVIPAQLLGNGASDNNGVVKLALPR